METNPFYQQLTSQSNGRNNETLILNEKSKTISLIRETPYSSRKRKQIPILSFPLNYDKNNSPFSLLLSTRYNNPFSLKKNKILKNIVHNTNKTKINDNSNKKIISKSLFNKPLIISRNIENKIKESNKSERRKKINILDFGNKLKLYDENEKKNKEKRIIEKRARELDEIYYDYDKSNQHHITNSFSGNRADLLKNKVCFVKGIVDYLYPKLILQKMEFIQGMKQKNYKENRQNLQHVKKGKYYIIKHRSPEQNAAISKYLYGGDLEIIRPRNNFIKIKKTLINKCKVSKLTNNYDYV